MKVDFKKNSESFVFRKFYIHSQSFIFKKYLSYSEYLFRKFLINLGFEIYKSLKFYILSYPRSGNHLLRYIIETLTGQPTLGAQNGKSEHSTIFSIDKPIYKKIEINIKSRKPIGLKRHHFENFSESGYELDLILILRYPIEAIFSHNLTELSKNFSIKIFMDEFDRYCELLKVYSTTKREKILIYYSDLLKNDMDTIMNLRNFLFKHTSDLNEVSCLNNEVAFGSLERKSYTPEVKSLLETIDKKTYLEIEKKIYDTLKIDFPFINTDKLFNK